MAKKFRLFFNISHVVSDKKTLSEDNGGRYLFFHLLNIMPKIKDATHHE